MAGAVAALEALACEEDVLEFLGADGGDRRKFEWEVVADEDVVADATGTVGAEGLSDEKDCLSWGAGDGAMAIAALMVYLEVVRSDELEK